MDPLDDPATRDAVREYAVRQGLDAVAVDLRLAGPFAAGHASSGLERVDVAVRTHGGGTYSLELVLKHTLPLEAAALRAMT